MSSPDLGSDEPVRPDGARGVLRVVIATVVAVVVVGIGLAVHDARDPERSLEREFATDGPLGAARSTVTSSLLATSAGPPIHMRTAGDLVLVVHGDAIRAVDPRTGTLVWTRPTAAGERIVRSFGDPMVAVTLAGTGARRTLTAIDPETGTTRWTREVEAPDEPIPQAVGTSPGATPPGMVVTPGAVLLQHGDEATPRLTCLDPETGERRWATDQGGRLTDADGEVVVLVRTGRVDGSTSFDVVDLVDGTLRWGAELGADGIDVTAHAQVVPGGPIVTADGAGNVRGHLRADGEVVWHLEEARRGEALVLSDEHILITQDRRRAYIGIDAADGFVRWRQDWLVPGPIALATEGGRAIVVSAHERVAGLSLDHGSRVWELDLDRASALVAARGNLIHADRRGLLTAISAATGRERWSTLPTSSRRIHLAAADGAVITAAPVGATENHEVTAWVDGEPIWTTSLRRVDGIGALTIEGDRVLATASGSASSEVIAVLDLETGDRVRSGLDTAGELGPDVRLTVTTSAELVVEEPDGTPRWRAPLPGTTHLDPIEVHGTVVTVAGALALGHDLADGRELWRATLPGPITGPPVTARGAIIVATTDGTIRALDPADGRTVDHYILAPLHVGPVSDGRVIHVVTTGGELISLGPRDPADESPSPPPIHPR